MAIDDFVVDSGWYTALLEEYKSLRTEALTARDGQLSILRLVVPLLAALIGLGVTVSLKDETVVGGLVLAVSVPLTTAIAFEMWNSEVQRTVRAGSYIAAIERRLATLFEGNPAGPPVGWELWLRSKEQPRYGKKRERSQQQADSVVSAAVIFIFLLVVAVVSFGLGIYFLSHYDHFTVMWITGGVIAAGFAALIARATYVAKLIESRNHVPNEREIWRDQTGVSVEPTQEHP